MNNIKLNARGELVALIAKGVTGAALCYASILAMVAVFG